MEEIQTEGGKSDEHDKTRRNGACSLSELQFTDRRKGGKQRTARRKTNNYWWRKRTKER